jgi:hypothetical protein
VETEGFSFREFPVNSVQLTAEQRRRALANPNVARYTAYADPTGETAVKNAMQGSAPND